MQGVQGEIPHPVKREYIITYDGRPVILPNCGSINYNVRLGDSAFGWIGEDIEAGVSVYNSNKEASEGLRILACIGNRAKVISGEAKGAIGIVTGKQAGPDGGHVTIDFSEEDINKMMIGDKISIKSYGQGFALEDYPQVKMLNIDPELFEKIDIEERDGKILVPIKAIIPQQFNGAGTGEGGPAITDVDISTSSNEEIEKYGIDKLCLGDFVLLEGADNCYGTAYLESAASIGVVVHGQSSMAGRGPGVVIIMTSKEDILRGKVCSEANIVNLISSLR